MSRRKNRERAEAGLIFRDGHLVRKEVWYAAHPDKVKQQAAVDQAVTDFKRAKQASLLIVKDGRVLDPKDTSAVLRESEPYFCTKCKVTHRSGTKVHQAHHQYVR